jgi:hypothetical protein
VIEWSVVCVMREVGKNVSAIEFGAKWGGIYRKS